MSAGSAARGRRQRGRRGWRVGRRVDGPVDRWDGWRGGVAGECRDVRRPWDADAGTQGTSITSWQRKDARQGDCGQCTVNPRLQSTPIPVSFLVFLAQSWVTRLWLIGGHALL